VDQVDFKHQYYITAAIGFRCSRKRIVHWFRFFKPKERKKKGIGRTN